MALSFDDSGEQWTTWTIPGCIPRRGDAVIGLDGAEFRVDHVRWDLNANVTTDPMVSLSVTRVTP